MQPVGVTVTFDPPVGVTGLTVTGVGQVGQVGHGVIGAQVTVGGQVGCVGQVGWTPNKSTVTSPLTVAGRTVAMQRNYKETHCSY